MAQVNISDLVPGMITKKDVYSHSNQLILAAQTKITDEIITRLEFLSIDSIAIQDDDGNHSPELEYTTHSQKIQHSKVFLDFNKTFFSSSKKLKSNLDNVALYNEELDTSLLLENINVLLEKNLYAFNIFDMLHNMRQYDDQTYVHSLNVGLICNTIGHWLGWNHEDIELLTLCGLIHDIGKILVPASIIRKPDVLTPSEFETVKFHTTDGFKKLEESPLNKHILNSVLQHHERCDGTGYPLGLTSDEIDPYAKVVAIADVYDAMTSARIYRGPLCPFHVIELFAKEGLTKYEPSYLLKFLENIAITYIHNQVLLNTDQIATVVIINKTNLSRPVVQIGDEFIDLSIRPDLQIISFV